MCRCQRWFWALPVIGAACRWLQWLMQWLTDRQGMTSYWLVTVNKTVIPYNNKKEEQCCRIFTQSCFRCRTRLKTWGINLKPPVTGENCSLACVYHCVQLCYIIQYTENIPSYLQKLIIAYTLCTAWEGSKSKRITYTKYARKTVVLLVTHTSKSVHFWWTKICSRTVLLI